MQPRPRAFTLIELLVVVTIIVVLLSLLTPTLDKAVSAAAEARCLANFHAVGQAITYYHGDYKRFYPVMNVWWGLLGDKGADAAYGDVTSRPLNRYLGYQSDGSRVPVAQCPSDGGDPSTDSDPATYFENAYKLIGSSYLAAYAPSNYEPTGYAGVKFIFGHAGGLNTLYGTSAPSVITPLPSVKQSSLEPPSNKMVVSEWVWHANRPTKDPRTRWHRPESPERFLSTLFADTHAEIFDWNKEYIDKDYGGVELRAYDRSWKWW